MSETRKVTINGETFEVKLEPDGNSWKATVEGETFNVKVEGDSTQPIAKPKRLEKKRKKSGTVSSSIPGKVITVEVEVGQEVAEGYVVLILEAMKMQNEVVAPISGTITEINCKSGENIEANLPLVVIEPPAELDNEP